MLINELTDVFPKILINKRYPIVFKFKNYIYEHPLTYVSFPNHQYLILPLYTNNRQNTIRTYVFD